MALPTPAPGLVISYAYLWRAQQQAGGEEGRKDRPCAIVVTAKDEDEDILVLVAPITHTPPVDGSAIEIPAKVKRRLGLDAARAWIVTDELNRFIWPGYDLRPIARDQPETFHWGFLPVELFEALKTAVLRHQRARRLGLVSRD
jgi:uncharacterized protein YifN (PemK superfamily)